ncbi:hypothetical protein AGOR_G00140700 [Albula goreensis]|uniref:Bcl-2 Bcl-2 homology region 1-3 domain-containing protein n=1 Tax=Albula goreensis TaxID=1534307 RepID=A0A8T3DA23_9TELE|nr:hypothetical protein AGOR_G00140700 [Albula goreensis]
MPPDIQDQTYRIVLCLFDDQYAENRGFANDLQTDGDDDDSFDPVIIADKLREIGDEIQETVIWKFKNDLQNAARGQVEKVFSSAVDTLCKSWVTEGEVAPEKHLLKASVMLGLYVKKNCPDMVTAVQSAMTTFLNTRVAPWVAQQGGWDNVDPE